MRLAKQIIPAIVLLGLSGLAHAADTAERIYFDVDQKATLDITNSRVGADWPSFLREKLKAFYKAHPDGEVTVRLGRLAFYPNDPKVKTIDPYRVWLPPQLQDVLIKRVITQAKAEATLESSSRRNATMESRRLGRVSIGEVDEGTRAIEGDEIPDASR